MSNLTAAYHLLGEGVWGIRVAGIAHVGDTVTVTKRNGQVKSEIVSGVRSQGAGVTVCEIAGGKSPARGRVAKPQYGRYTRFNSGSEMYQNSRGRCEDAPCCGCCS